MRYEMILNPETFYHMVDVLWQDNNKRYKQSLVIGLIVGAIVFVFGFMGPDNRIFRDITVAVGLAILLVYTYAFYNLKKDKEEYVDVFCTYYSKPGERIMEFDKEYFFYKDQYYESKLKWTAFKNYFIIEDIVYLAFHNVYYLISEKEVGKKGIDDIIGFMEEKIIPQVETVTVSHR